MSSETQAVDDILEHMHPQFRLGHAAAREECKAEIDRLRQEIADLRCSVVAFGAPWAVEYARDFGLPTNHLHPTHYDILARAGARMDSFVRHEEADGE